MVERFEKFSLNFSILLFVVNVILVPLWFIIISLVFLYHRQGFLSGFLQFSSDFVNGHNNLKYRNCAPLKICTHHQSVIPCLSGTSPPKKNPEYPLIINNLLGF